MQTPHLNATSAFRYDFFIVSQAVRFGCVSPTHYNVVFDNSGLKPDHMQRLTYKLCHMYYNWQVTTNVDQYHTTANSSTILCRLMYSSWLSFFLLWRGLSECLHHVSMPTNWPSWLDRAFTRSPTWIWMTSCTTCNLLKWLDGGSVRINRPFLVSKLN